jgi:hypothetical protein
VFRRFSLGFALAAAVGCSALAYAQNDDASSEQPKSATDYSMVVKRMNGQSNAGTENVHKVLNNADVYYRIHLFNSSGAPANVTVSYTIFHKTNIDRNGNSQDKITNVPGNLTLNMAAHTDKVVDTKAASARDLQARGQDNNITGQVMGVYVEMLVDGKKMDSYENPEGIRAEMRKNAKHDDQPALAPGQD